MHTIVTKSADGSSSNPEQGNERTGSVEIIEIFDDDGGLSKESTRDRNMSLTEVISVNLEEYNDFLYKEEEVMVPIEQTRDSFFSLICDGNPNNFNLTNIINRTEKPQMLNPDALVSIIDGRSIYAAIARMGEELHFNRHEWSRAYIRMIFKSRFDGNEMKTGGLLKRSKLAN